VTGSPVAPPQQSMVTESWIFARRLFLQWRRYPLVPMQALLFPTLLLIVFSLLVGKSMIQLTGRSSLDVLIPVCAVAGAMSGCLGAGLTLPYDRDTGVMTRMWIMPVHRYSALGGTLLAEAVRTLIGTVILVATGYALGFRFHNSSIAVIAYLFIPVLTVVAFATIVIPLALSRQGRTILPWVGVACIGLAFVALIPAHKIPEILRPLAGYQPVAVAIETMRVLSVGTGALGPPLLLALTSSVVVAAVCGPMAVRSYRVAAETGKVDS
jgi:ABC-2 type transport system permease protein